jgi:hypothetical protein
MRAAGLAVAALALALGAPAGAAVSGQVTYRVGGSVYVDVGGLDGLAPGDTLEVLRAGARVGRVRARDVAARRAACDTLAGGQGAIAVGDAVRFTPRRAPPPPAAEAADSARGVIGGPAPPAAQATAGYAALPRPARSIRGRAGMSAWSLRAGRERSFVEPAADLWLDARGLAGGRLDAVLDVRGRSIAPVGGSRVERQSFGARVFRAAASWHDAGSRRSLTVGRQFAPAFSGVSLFDGIVARTAGRRIGGGVLAGAQPRVGRLEPSLDVLEAGAFVEAFSAPASAGRWTATLGGVSSWQDGVTNRDFLFLRGSWQDPRLALFVAQEADVARGWRTAFLPATVTLTSTFASARVEVTPLVQARAGFDGRRSVPLHRDRATPETEFDDARREGAWLGASVRPRPFLRLDAELRRRFGSASERMTAWNGGAEAAFPGARPVRLRGRAARADGEDLRTTLVSVALECDVLAGLSLGAGGGVRTTADSRAGFEERTPWWNMEGDWAIAAGWSLAGSFEHEDGDPRVDLGRLGAAYRF